MFGNPSTEPLSESRRPSPVPAGGWQRAREYFGFTWAFLRHPSQVGALCPSSPWLAEAMVDSADLGNARTVLELGPGTGAFTRTILARKGRHTKYLGIELSPDAVRLLRSKFPGLDIHEGSATCLGQFLAQRGWRHADFIVSGLPFANMPSVVQRQILEAVVAALAPQGRFTTFAYVGPHLTKRGRSFQRLLRELFGSVETSRPVLRNLPPAFVYRCSLGEKS
ncbi:MAG: methyltransferase domain-containing protein [Verrucomicrobia bacterium]|nr:methyltransferase domain-containing protein [Verrucomicrobiota bacterium]